MIGDGEVGTDHGGQASMYQLVGAGVDGMILGGTLGGDITPGTDGEQDGDTATAGAGIPAGAGVLDGVLLPGTDMEDITEEV